LAEAACEAMPEAYEPLSPAAKQNRLEQIAGRLLVGRLLLPAGTPEFELLRKKIARYLEKREWPDSPVQEMPAEEMPMQTAFPLAASRRRDSDQLRKVQTLFVLGFVLVALVIVWLGILLRSAVFGEKGGGGGPQQEAAAGAASQPKAIGQDAGNANKGPAGDGDSKTGMQSGGEAKTRAGAAAPAKTDQPAGVGEPERPDKQPRDAQPPEGKTAEVQEPPATKEGTKAASKPIKPAPIGNDQTPDNGIEFIAGSLDLVPPDKDEQPGLTDAAFLKWEVAMSGAAAKAKPPKWFEPFLMACELRVTLADGSEERVTTKNHDYKLPSGTDKLKIRIAFSLPVANDNPLGKNEELVAQTGWFPIEDIRRGSYYVVRFVPSDRGQRELVVLGKGAGKPAARSGPRPANW
jgi:hypothetical protein